MKIIDVGVCTNNKDPKGIGRIRYVPYGQFKSEIEKSMPYEEWDENDQFIAIPFLPPHINVIPQVRQSVKLIKYDTEKDTQNVEYVCGPFSSPHDFGSETFTSQHKNTTYGGVIVKDLPNVRNKIGEFIDKKTVSTISNLTDTAIYGNYGSDIVFTQNGLVIRGGKLISKETSNGKLRQRLYEVPLLSEKMAKITLKKFPKTMVLSNEETTTTSEVVSKIKYIIEYDVNDLSNPTIVRLYAYKVINSSMDKFNTNWFGSTTEVDFTDTTTIKLINIDSTTTTPTYEIAVDDISDVYPEIRNFLYTIDKKGLYEYNSLFPREDIHPFFFRPTQEFKLRSANDSALVKIKNDIIQKIEIRGSSSGSSLVFSVDRITPPVSSTTKIERELKEDNTTNEQSFASISSDLMYLISTSVNKGTLLDAINFTELNSYELTQEDYLSKIDPNTYAVVRGEALIVLLNLLYEFLVGHVHNINEPPIYKPDVESKLRDAILKMQTDLINKSIRIN